MEKSNLEKNLEEISRYNPELANTISQHIQLDNNFQLLEAKSGDIILSYNGILLHDDVDPQDEAIRVFSRLSDNSKSTVNVLYGLGLGYLFKRFSDSCKGKIVLFEPNLDILRITFELVDFSQDLAKENIAVVNKIEDIAKCFEKFYFGEAKATLSFLDSYAKKDAEILSKIVHEVSFLEGLYVSSYKNLFNKCDLWTETGIKNIPEVLRNCELESLRDKFKNKPAVIISAGPSLDKWVEVLRDNQDKVVTFCVGTAFKTVVKHGIKPDFVVIVESNSVTSQVSGVDVSDVNLILHPMTHKEFHELEVKTKLNYYPSNDFTTRWLSQYLDVELEDYVNLGTVSLCALHSAKIVGCNPIILVGQDLAFANGRCYSKDSPYHNLVCKKDEKTGQIVVEPDNFEEYAKVIGGIDKDAEFTDADHLEAVKNYINNRFSEITKNIYFVKGQDGEMLPTDPGYATFIKYFEQTSHKIGNEIKLVNSSTGGAYLEGFEHIPFDEAMKKYVTEPIEVKNVVDEAVKSSRNLQKEKLPEVLNAVDYTLALLNTHKTNFEKGKIAANKLKKEFEMRGFYSQNISKYCKDILINFIEIEEKMIIPNLLLQGLMYPPYSKFSNYLKNVDDIVTESTIRTFIELSSDFFVNINPDRYINIIKEVRDRLNEGCNSAS